MRVFVEENRLTLTTSWNDSVRFLERKSQPQISGSINAMKETRSHEAKRVTKCRENDEGTEELVDD